MRCRTLLCLTLGLTCLAWSGPGRAADSDEEITLYNGLRIPSRWPPKVAGLSREPIIVPYLVHPPAFVAIDVGRQLFVDDVLIDSTTLKRTFHQAQYHQASPVLRPDEPWERDGKAPTAMTFSDGVWYDPADQLFKMWYMGGYLAATCYATSRDGIRWEKPALDVVPGANVVMRGWRDSSTVWLDHQEKDLQRRFKMFVVGKGEGKGWGMRLHASPDGIHWGPELAVSPGVGDRTTVFYNPFRNVWVYSLRTGLKDVGRARAYREHTDVVAGMAWTPADTTPWTCADKLDPRNPNPELAKVEPQLYNLDAVAYESILLGLFSVWQGDPSSKGFQKRNEVLVGYSRDGFHWHRPDRKPLLPVDESAGAWNWGNVQSTGGGCLVVGDKLYFYASGRGQDRKQGENATGLATLRRDGFVSLDAGDEEGVLTTRLVKFTGKHAFVNVDAGRGQLQAEILDMDGAVKAPFSKANCTPVRVDKTLVQLHWKGAEDLSAAVGQFVAFRFHLRRGSLYSFWVSQDRSGASRGYVAAGGPKLTGPTDTVGVAGY